MTHLERILAIYTLLKQSPHGADQLAQHVTKGTAKSRTQIHRDLKEVELLAATRQEKLTSIKAGRYNRKFWKVESIEFPEETLTNREVDTYFIMRAVLPGVFARRRMAALERLHDTLQQQVINSTSIKYRTGVSDKTFTNSHFYENRVTYELDLKLTDLLEEVSRQRSIIITELTGDATAVRDYVRLPVSVKPIKLIFHRGCFYVAVVHTADNRALIFQIDQISWKIDAEFTSAGRLRKLVDKDLKNRFGVTQNFDEKSYTVELLFSETTGKFVGEQNWHHSQKIKPVNGPSGETNYLLTLQCGINRELVGWLFQWMSNVKVLGPPELVELYNEQLDRMTAIRAQETDTSLEYTNMFAPKP